MKLLIALIFFLLLFQSCDIFISPDEPDLRETKDQLKEINNKSDFTKIKIKGAADIHLSKGTKRKITLRGNKKHFKYVQFTTDGNTLICDTHDDLPFKFDVEIYITMPTISGIALSGAGEIEMGSFGKLSHLDLDLSGAGEFDTEGAPTRLSRLDISISGAGSVDAEDLIAQEVKVSVSGAGSAEVNAVKALGASVSGVGSITYRGNPKVNKRVSGIGSISRD